MTTYSRFTRHIAAAALAALLAAPVAAQRPPVVIDGHTWMSSSRETQKAFLVGAGNMIAAELAYAKKNGTPPPPVGSRLVTAVEDLTLDDVSNRITRWYESNPGRRSLPVMGVLWIDMVAPATGSK